MLPSASRVTVPKLATKKITAIATGPGETRPATTDNSPLNASAPMIIRRMPNRLPSRPATGARNSRPCPPDSMAAANISSQPAFTKYSGGETKKVVQQEPRAHGITQARRRRGRTKQRQNLYHGLGGIGSESVTENEGQTGQESVGHEPFK